MADSDPVTMARLNYWCREKHYRHMQQAALTGLKKYGNDPILKFYNAYGMVLEGRVQEGIRELSLLKDKRDVNLCSIMAMIYGYKKEKNVDREAVTELDAKLKEERKQAGEKGLYFAGLFLFNSERYDKAKDYIDRVLKMAPSSKEGLALKGWLELMGGRDAQAKKAVKYFDDALGQDGPKDIDALFGKAKYFENRRNFSGALDLINQAVVAVPNFLPALIEKMKVCLSLQDWEQTIENAQRALNSDPNCLQAQRFLIMYQLCREGVYSEAANKISELFDALETVEPKNPHLLHEFAKVFCRVCGRNSDVLSQTYLMQEKAMSLENTNADYVNELGYELLLQGKTKESLKCCKNAMKIDETSVPSLMGIIKCQLHEGMIEEAAHQLEFLQEIQQSIGQSSELIYLNALLAMKRAHPPEQVIELLNQAVESHFAKLKGLPLGIDYYYILNPDFVIQIVGDYLNFAPQQPSTQAGQPQHPVLKRCVQLLDPITRAVPGLMDAQYLMAKVKFLSGEVDAAQSSLQHCLDQDASFSDAHILMAQIHLHKNNFKLANQSLEVGLSHNFEVREHPLYHLIKARILKKQGENAEAVRTLQMAMNLPGIKSGKGGRSNKTVKISINDRVSLFLELAEAHRLMGQQPEAAKVMQDAINEFQGSPEEIRITIANADLALGRGDVEGALAMLRNITPEQSYFVQAREKMAEIYLHHRKDKRLYASCYRELVDKYPSPHTCILLGDAYMSILEPEKAIEVYEAALKKNPRDAMLASKIGRALVKTHHYGKAIAYYESALKTGGQACLRHDLSELLIRLRQFDKAEKILRTALAQNENPTELDILIEHSKYYVLLSRVYHCQDKMEDCMLHLSKAREIQSRVLKRVQVEQPDGTPAQKQLAADICSQMAKNCSQMRDFDKAIKFYREALSHLEDDGKIMLELCKLHLAVDDLDSCQQQCMTLLKNDKENDAATMMMADIMFRKNEYEQAMFHFQQLLERRPDHYEGLARLVDLMRRGGKIEDVPKYFEIAEKANPRCHMDGGFNYCKGLYEWHTGNPTSALKFFNKARKDSEWGMQATYNMVEICLNPDNETIGGEAFESVDQDIGAATDKSDSEQLALRTADKLIRDIKPKPGDTKGQILQAMTLVASKNKSKVEQAISQFMEITEGERDHVGALYGMAAAYMVIKQTPRARNQLKRMAKSNWTWDEGEDLEKSWLLLADIYIQSGKYDMANELLKRCIQHNLSCCKAYEYMGFIMEKEQSYKDAARNYELAWKYSNKNNPNIGYKLAFNLLKSKRYTVAIDICHHILSQHPDYPKIRKDILDKARSNLRV